MTDTPWQGDACSLVDAFRAGERSPVEELEATLAAIEASDLNCFSYVDPERAREAAASGRRVAALRRRAHRDQGARAGRGLALHRGVARVQGPQGAATPRTTIAAPLRARRRRCRSARRPPASSAGSTSASPRSTASPTTRGSTAARSAARRAARRPRWPAGSVSLATGGDGGGSIRIPAGYTGLLGMKGTFGRIPRGPHAYMRPQHRRARQPQPLGARRGPLLRRVRRRAPRRPDQPARRPAAGRPGSAPRTSRGQRVAVVPNLGGVDARAGRRGPHPRPRPRRSSPTTGMVEVDLRRRAAEPRRPVDDGQPGHAARRPRRQVAGLLRRPHRRDRGRPPPGAGALQPAHRRRGRGAAHRRPTRSMAAAFEQVDFIIAATNPGPAFPAEAVTSQQQAPIDRRSCSAPGAPAYALRGAARQRPAASPARCPKLPSALLVEAVGAAPRPRRTWARSRSSRTSTATRRCRSPPAPSTACPSACRCSPPPRRRAALRRGARGRARAPWPMVAPGVA